MTTPFRPVQILRVIISNLQPPTSVTTYNLQPPSSTTIPTRHQHKHHNQPPKTKMPPKLPRLVSTSPLLRISPRHSSTFTRPASPPKLPPSEQAEFERLQRAAAQALETPPPPPPTTQNAAESVSSQSAPAATSLNQGLFRGAPPEFSGDVNPKTGEVGGPKNEPLRWGGKSDWSYNGRATDF